MAPIKPILLYGHSGTPNPTKVQIMLEELDLPYTTEEVGMAVIKQEPYISINPHGRVPSITDPNTGVTMFESGAILQYLIEEYDKDEKFTYANNPEKALVKSWLHVQMSFQGPMYGQLAWFMRYHPEPVPSAVERYKGQARRIMGIIDTHLRKQGTEYLVGDKYTIADLAFLPWNHVLPLLLGKEESDGEDSWGKEFPIAYAWHKRLKERGAVRKVLGLNSKPGK